MSQFFHGVHSGLTACSCSRQYPATSHSHWRGVGQQFHRPQATAWSTLCKGNVLHCMRQMVVTPNTDWFSDPQPYFFLCVCDPQTHLYSQSCDIQRLDPKEFISTDWLPYMNCNSVKSLKLLHVAFIFLSSVHILSRNTCVVKSNVITVLL